MSERRLTRAEREAWFAANRERYRRLDHDDPVPRGDTHASVDDRRGGLVLEPMSEGNVRRYGRKHGK